MKSYWRLPVNRRLILYKTIRLKRAAQLLEEKSVHYFRNRYEVGFNNPAVFRPHL